MNRRTFITASGLTASGLNSSGAAGQTPSGTSRISAIITAYYRNSHADVFIGNMLRGFYWEGRPHRSGLEIAAMYLAQTPANDIGRSEAAKHGIPLKPSVREAIVPGIQGVALIGEHGDYPTNEKGQKLYPRYELMEQIVAAYRETGRALPMFVDKHFSTEWRKAKQMFEWSRELKFPLIAGTSLTLTWRRPALELDLEAPVKRAVGYFYGGKEAYGYHGVEVFQSMVERRKGGETGVDWVQCLEGDEVWKWSAANPWARDLLEESMRNDDTLKRGRLEEIVKQPILFLIGYRSGLEGVVYLVTGATEQAGFAAQVEGRREPLTCCFRTQWGRPWSHGNGLSYWVEQTIRQGREFYPPERTLLATGIIEALMNSSYEKGRKFATPHLDVRYHARKESRFMRGPLPPYDRIRV
ncbi:MAG: hypothetical protein IANPNBLG_03968 [Bryobacteraceae bacterium]|nr:hypothetical protein [Bryobacteraceae bacterium]